MLEHQWSAYMRSTSQRLRISLSHTSTVWMSTSYREPLIGMRCYAETCDCVYISGTHIIDQSLQRVSHTMIEAPGHLHMLIQVLLHTNLYMSHNQLSSRHRTIRRKLPKILHWRATISCVIIHPVHLTSTRLRVVRFHLNEETLDV